MGLFDDAGIDPSELKVDRLAKGIYNGVVSKVDVKHGSKPETSDQWFFVIEYSIPEWEYPIQDWNRILPPGRSLAQCDDVDDSFSIYTRSRDKAVIRKTEKKFYQDAYKALKRKLMDIGVPEDRVNSISGQELVNAPVALSIDEDQNSPFPVLRKVSKPNASGVTMPTAPSIPTVSVPAMPTVVVSTPPAAATTAVVTPAVPQANPFSF